MKHVFWLLPWSIIILVICAFISGAHSFLDSTCPFSSYEGLSCYPTSPAINLTTFGGSSGAANITDDNGSASNESNRTVIESTTTLEPDEVDDTSDKFLSFEEWKKLNLERSGQTPQNIHHTDYNRGYAPKYIEDDDMDMSLNVFGSENSLQMAQKTEGSFSDETLSKTYKNRFNYASFDCAATIVKSNVNMKGAGNVLNENKDTYLNNECQESNKFVIIELCQDILVDTVILANFEFFSSMFRKFRISVSDKFPVPSSGWSILGEFEAQSVRDLQSFHVENPLIWARYLQIEFLTHWGHEFYCPVSLVRVHGTTMMEEYRNQEEYAKGDVPQGPVKIKEKTEISTPTSTQSYLSSYSIMHPKLLMDKMDYLIPSEFKTIASRTKDPTADRPASTLSADIFCMKNMDSNFMSKMSFSPLILDDSCHWDEYSLMESTSPELSQVSGPQTDSTISTASTSTSDVTATLSGGPSSASPDVLASNSTARPSSAPESRTQDSIYQTFMKRLSLLESNATLSMKYIENQSQNLRELLSKIEKKQNSKLEAFFDEINSTIVSQLQAFQNQYSNLVISIVNDLNTARSLNNRDISALSSRLAILADDLMYQRRINMVQGVILLIVMFFVITTRGTPTENFSFSRSKFTKLWDLGTPFDSASSPSLGASDESDFTDNEGTIYYDNGGFISEKPTISRNLPTFSSSMRKEEDQGTGYLSPNDTEDENQVDSTPSK